MRPRFTRRQLLASAPLALLGLSGCVQPIRSRPPGDPNHAEILCFQGGYGIDFFQQAARELEALRPGTSVKLGGDPRVWDQLRPLFIAGLPPDLAYGGWGFDHWAYLYDEQLAAWDAALDGPAWDGETRWRDTFDPTFLKLGQHEGRQYLMPYFVNLFGWFYNVGMFRQHGWEPPRTWGELLSLGAEMQRAGIAPLTFQGMYANYAVMGFWYPWAISAGGMEAYHAAQNLEPGAWKHPAFVEAARRILELRERDFFLPGSHGLSHTEAQMAFLQGRAALIPCGTWFHNEMRHQIPPGFEMALVLPPSIEGGLGDPTAAQVAIEPWVLPAFAANPALGVDYYRYLTSPEKARQFVQEKGTVTAVRGSDMGELPLHAEAAARILREAQVTYIKDHADWYRGLNRAIQDHLGQLYAGRLTPEALVEAVERAAGEVRADPDVPKHRVGE